MFKVAPVPPLSNESKTCQLTFIPCAILQAMRSIVGEDAMGGSIMRILEIIIVIFIVLFLVDLFGTQFLGRSVYILLVVAVILVLVRFVRRT